MNIFIICSFLPCSRRFKVKLIGCWGLATTIKAHSDELSALDVYTFVVRTLSGYEG